VGKEGRVETILVAPPVWSTLQSMPAIMKSFECNMANFIWEQFSRSSSYHNDKKENEIFLIYKEIHMRAVAKSCMRKGFLIYEEMRNYLTI
jgi:hypothetical protein